MSAKFPVSFREENFEALENLKKERHSSRSAIIQEAFEFWVKSQKEQKLIEQYEKGYKKYPEKVQETAHLEEIQGEILDEGEW